MPIINLRCVDCGNPLAPIEPSKEIRCAGCGRRYPVHPQHQVPIFVREKSKLSIEEILGMQTTPQEIDLQAAQKHWQTGNLIELLESSEGKRLLNYGSGDGGDRKWLEARGYEVTTFDIYPGEYTDFICDGHELPFADTQFDIVTSTAVFEHLYDPFKAASEIYRVLKPGGAHVGSASFLEPFHSDSYFHMTHLGLTEVFKRAGFREVNVYPGWSYLESLDGKFWLWNRIGPIRRVHFLWARFKFRIGKAMWSAGYRAKGSDLPPRITLGFSGSLIFKAVK